MWINHEKKAEDFLNPILGMKMKIVKKNNRVKYIEYRFNEIFFQHDELIYAPGGSYTKSELDASVRKIYNDNWIWYTND